MIDTSFSFLFMLNKLALFDNDNDFSGLSVRNLQAFQVLQTIFLKVCWFLICNIELFSCVQTHFNIFRWKSFDFSKCI